MIDKTHWQNRSATIILSLYKCETEKMKPNHTLCGQNKNGFKRKKSTIFVITTLLARQQTVFGLSLWS